jgi:hypothetical protein
MASYGIPGEAADFEFDEKAAESKCDHELIVLAFSTFLYTPLFFYV